MGKLKYFPLFFIMAVFMTGIVTSCGDNTQESLAGIDVENKDSVDAYFERMMDTVASYYNKRHLDSLYEAVPVLKEQCKAYEQWYIYYYSWAFMICSYATEGRADEANQALKELTADALARNSRMGESMSHMAMGTIYALCNYNLELAAKEYKQALSLYPPDEHYSPRNWMMGMLIQVLCQEREIETVDSLLKVSKADLEKIADMTKNGKKIRDTQSYSFFCANYFYSLYQYHFLASPTNDPAYACLDSIDSIAAHGQGDVTNLSIMSFIARTQLLIIDQKFDECQKVIEWGDSALPKRMEVRKLVARFHYVLNRERGDLGAALESLEYFTDLMDTINTEETRAKLDELNKRFEVDTVKHKAELQKSHFTNIIAIGTAVAFALLLALGMWSRSRLRKKNTQLRIAYDQLEETTTIKERMASELRIARDIQMSMVPSVFPDYEGLDMYASMTPAKEVGGDLYGYVLLGDKLYFALGDVSGKGVPASLFMAQATRLFRTLSAQQMMPAEICTRMNDALSGDDNESGMFVTFFLGLLDLKTGHLSFCNAGHNPPVIGGGDNHGDFLDMIPNAPIGLFPGLEYEGEEVDDVKGRPLFIYTDGLNEAENREQEQFGDDRLLDILRANRFDSAKQLIDTLNNEVERHRNGADPNDDLTMMCIRLR